MLTFQQGLDFLGDKPKKALEHKTYLVKYDDDTLGVVFHTTIVVYIFRSGIYQYDTGGWRNTSVKNRINKYGPKKIHHKHGMWMLDNSIFDDGVRLNTNGDILTPLRTVAVKQKQTLDSKVLKYVNNFCEHVLKHGLKLAGNIDNPWHVDLKGQELLFPGVGDCWSCYFGLTSDSHLKEPLGVQHLLEHIENSYFVPSLLAKAIITTTDNPVPYLVWNDIAEEVNQGNADSVKKVLKKYFRARKSLMS